MILECTYCGLDYKVTNRVVMDGLDRGTITGHYCSEACWNADYDAMIAKQNAKLTKECEK